MCKISWFHVQQFYSYHKTTIMPKVCMRKLRLRNTDRIAEIRLINAPVQHANVSHKNNNVSMCSFRSRNSETVTDFRPCKWRSNIVTIWLKLAAELHLSTLCRHALLGSVICFRFHLVVSWLTLMDTHTHTRAYLQCNTIIKNTLTICKAPSFNVRWMSSSVRDVESKAH